MDALEALNTMTPPPDDRKDINKRLREEIASSKQYRRKLITNWSQSVDYRRGKPFSSQSDQDRVVVNLDWSMTKSKHAALFSQVPVCRVTHPPQSGQAPPWLHTFEQRINDTLITAGIDTAMDEALPDCINAAGIGIIMVSHEAITDTVTLPSIDLGTLPPEVHQMVLSTGMMPDGTPISTEEVPRVLDHRYLTSRISPADFLWPLTFVGSDFDNAPWIGRTGRMTWAQAQKQFNLDPTEKDSFLGSDNNRLDKLASAIDTERGSSSDDLVAFDEIFYKEYQQDPAAKSYSSIHHLILMDGRSKPIIDEPWKGQQDAQDGTIIGATKYPIRVLTLSYLTDEAIPPSDSAIIRPQVNEINKSRSQMIQQREHSMPIRYFDVNRIDPLVQQAIMRGTWQQMIPVQGNGANAIGEVTRSAMPSENFAFDRIAKADYREAVGLGQEDSGRGIETSGEAEVVQNNYQTRMGRERAKVGKFFCSIAEVLGGLICLYEPTDSFGEGFDPSISRTLAYSILADSTVLLDANQRIQKLISFINFGAKSGYVDVEPVMREIASLVGLDPNIVIRAPQPAPPVEPNISLRMTGTEDMLNPLMLAILMKSGQAPDPDLVEKAKQLISLAVNPPSTAPPNPSIPQPPPPAVGSANPDWSLMNRVNQRAGEE